MKHVVISDDLHKRIMEEGRKNERAEQVLVRILSQPRSCPECPKRLSRIRYLESQLDEIRGMQGTRVDKPEQVDRALEEPINEIEEEPYDEPVEEPYHVRTTNPALVKTLFTPKSKKPEDDAGSP